MCTKRCRSCGQTLPASDFNAGKAGAYVCAYCYELNKRLRAAGLTRRDSGSCAIEVQLLKEWFDGGENNGQDVW